MVIRLNYLFPIIILMISLVNLVIVIVDKSALKLKLIKIGIATVLTGVVIFNAFNFLYSNANDLGFVEGISRDMSLTGTWLKKDLIYDKFYQPNGINYAIKYTKNVKELDFTDDTTQRNLENGIEDIVYVDCVKEFNIGGITLSLYYNIAFLSDTSQTSFINSGVVNF